MRFRSDIRAVLSPRGLPRDKIAAALRCFILMTVFVMARLDSETRPAAFDLVLAIAGAYVLVSTFLPWAKLASQPRYDFRRATMAMLATDVMLITALIYTHSGIRSEYYLLYYLPILHASVRLNFRDAVSACLLAAASYLLVGVLERPAAAITVTVISRVSTFAVSAALLAAFFIFVSREQRAYQRLTEHYQKAMQAKSEFLSRVSHEFRTPLTAIVGFSQLLYEHERELDPARQHEYLTVVREQAQHLARMIEDMLDITRIDDGQLVLQQEAVSLPEAIASATSLVDDLGDSARGGLRVSVDPATPAAWADRKEIEQAIARILFHVLALSQDDPVSLRVRPAGDDGDRVQVSVESAALHTREDRLSPLFDSWGASFASESEPEERASRAESLGLRVARALIELHRGQIWLERGERWPAISFTLPACRPRQGGAEAVAAIVGRGQEGAEANGEGENPDHRGRPSGAETDARQPELLGR